jgi:putative component of membrane protein insertase Oxa1/YidC/SpoIIIJ protein YidD
MVRPSDREARLIFLLHLTMILVVMSFKTMYSARLDTFARQTAIGSIQLYQQYLSPRKGFSCPRRLRYGERSCSEYVKHLLLEPDLNLAIQKSVQRFQSCALAAQALQLQNQGGCIVIPCCIPL